MINLSNYIYESLKDWDKSDWLELSRAYNTNHVDEVADIVDKSADNWQCWADQQQYFCVWYMIKYADAKLNKSKDGMNMAPFSFDREAVIDKKTGKNIPGAVADGKHSWKDVADAIKEYFD